VESSDLQFEELLAKDGIDPKTVVVFRHSPKEAKLDRIFDWLVAERPDLFNRFQSNHGQKAEASLKKAKYLASFLRFGSRDGLFVGLYEVVDIKERSLVDLAQDRAIIELVELGMEDPRVGQEGRSLVADFDLRRTDWHQEWIGRLVVEWPPGRNYTRWAGRNEFLIKALTQESLLIPPMPSWSELSLSCSEIALLPNSWRARLSEWRGIYLITDVSDRRAYVGSAYGSENILQRWLNYSRSGHGGNKLLRERNPGNFVFSILQRVSPDMPPSEVVAIENSWKIRLRTRSPDGLNDN
jgi:hypothetical protein